MKLELTNENKVRFFALYLGSNVIYPKTDTGFEIAQLTGVSKEDGLETTYKIKRKGCSGDYLAFNFNGNHDCNALNTKLLLKPLSSISDEDAWEVGLRVNCWSKSERTQSWFTSKEDDFHKVHILGGQAFSEAIGKEWGHGHSHPFANNSTDILNAYDFLRSRGYALPWMGLSVDEMCQAGWIKLVES